MKKRKGIILAGGSGSRLYPVTSTISKQLLPVYDKPMVYYPLSSLMLTGIRDILLICLPRDRIQFENLLGDGSNWGISITYAEQASPDGLAQAFLIGEAFLNGHPSVLVLGDNIFFGNSFQKLLKSADEKIEGATIFAYHVQDPHRYGIVTFNNSKRVLSIEEKPEKPKSNFAITGLYFYDEKVIEYAKKIQPSSRGELEITDINQLYLKNNSLNVEHLGRGYAWFDAGTHQSLLDASQFVSAVENRQNLKISCPEEIAYRQGWISSQDLKKIAEKYSMNSYGKYLHNVLNEG